MGPLREAQLLIYRFNDAWVQTLGASIRMLWTGWIPHFQRAGMILAVFSRLPALGEEATVL